MRIGRSVIEVESEWGVRTRSSVLSHEPSSLTLAVLFPGQNYGCDLPLMWYARKAALLAGCDTLSLEYGYQVVRTKPTMDQFQYLVEEASVAIQKALQPSYSRLLFISKSLGTVVAGDVAKRFSEMAVSHLFLTPIASTLPHLLGARGVVFTGSADTLFGEEFLGQIRGQEALDVIEVPNVGHSLELDEDVLGSLEILRQVCAACTRLAEQVC